MSRESVEVVRQPLGVRERSSRTLDQQLSLRFPRLAAANTRLLGKLSPSSRLRRALLPRAVRLASEAYNRRDLYIETTSEVWGAENYLMPFELIDLGERFVVMATVPMRAQASGVSLTEAFAYVATLKDGRPIRFQEYFDHTEALEAVGLGE